jgi:hypothetical protein
MPKGRKPKMSELASALEQLKQGFSTLITTLEKKLGEPPKSVKPVKRKYQKRRADNPEKNEPAYSIYAILAKANKPVKVEALAKKTGKSAQSIKLYLSRYKCFENVWGKGYRVK